MKFLIVLNVVLLAIAFFHAHLGLSALAVFNMIMAIVGSSKTGHEATRFKA